MGMVGVHVFVLGAILGVSDIPISDIPKPLRWTIRGTFFLVLGVSLTLAHRDRVMAGRFAKRLAILVGCAGAVTVTSLVLFPSMPVYFGILHSLAVCSLLAVPFLRFVVPNVLLGVLAIVAAACIADPRFDPPLLRWLGLGSVHPQTLDFQPILPGFGLVLIGIAAGRQLQRRGVAARPSRRAPAVALAWVGRHTLLLYMVHVPALIAVMEIIKRVA